MKLTFVVPCYNASKNLQSLYGSLIEQSDKEFSVIFVNDMSNDDTEAVISNLIKADGRFTLINNNEKKYALKSIIDVSSHVDDIVAVIDGDDQLCNNETVKLLKDCYTKNGESTVAWTAHKWDINGMNISKELPKNIDPYQYQWSSSHLKSFHSSLLKQIDKRNFTNHKNEWFKRGYDQALMLPLLKIAKNRVYINDVCYLYNINSCSLQSRSWSEKDQLQTINFVRARGFIK